MNSEAVLKKLEEIFRETLDNKNISLTDSSSANDIAEWDSVSHLILLHAIEQGFQITFSLEEVMAFREVGDIKKSIQSKI